MTKKDSMQKEVEKTEKGEQYDLLDVSPENAMPIIAAARVYKKLVAARIATGVKEVEQKQKILSLIKGAKLQTLDGGKIKFKYDNVTVSVTPRDELVQVKDENE